MTDPVLLSVDRGGVRTLTLNRPHRKNANDPELWVALRDALDAAGRDRGVRALMLTGAGGSFCSGADISVRDDVHPPGQASAPERCGAGVARAPGSQVAKVTGVAVGAGWNLALGCDLVVAMPESTFCQIFSKRGLSIDLGGSWLLPRLVGLQQAKRLTLLVETIGATEARPARPSHWPRPRPCSTRAPTAPYATRRPTRPALRPSPSPPWTCPPPMPPSPSGGSRRLLVSGR